MNRTAALDRLAIFLSGACLLHCLLASFFVALLPAISLLSLAEDELFHQILLVFIIPISTIALVSGMAKHRSWPIVISGVIGLTTLLAAALLGHDFLSPAGEKILTGFGGIILAIAHFFNFRRCT